MDTSGFSYIIHTVLEGYDSFVFLVSFLLMLLNLTNVWASVDVTVIHITFTLFKLGFNGLISNTKSREIFKVNLKHQILAGCSLCGSLLCVCV